MTFEDFCNQVRETVECSCAFRKEFGLFTAYVPKEQPNKIIRWYGGNWSIETSQGTHVGGELTSLLKTLDAPRPCK